MVKRQWWWVGAVCVLAACDSQTQSQSGASAEERHLVANVPVETVITVAYMATGSQAGVAARQGAELALEEANGKAWQIQGESVRFELQNVGSAKTASLPSALKSKNAVAALGYFNPAQTAVLQQHKIPAVNLSGDDSTTDGSSVFHIGATVVQQGGLIGRYLAAEQGMKQVAIISHGEQTQRTQALQNSLQAAGAQASMYILGQASQANVRQMVAQLTAAAPQIVFYSGDEKSAATLVKKMQKSKLFVPLMLSEQSFGENFIRQAGRYAPGSMAVVPGLPLAQMTHSENFISAFTRRYKSKPNEQAAYGYDAAWALMTAMKLADSTDPAIYVSKLKTLNMPSGLLSGALTFNDRGWRNEAVLTVYQVEEGRWQPADSIKANPNQTAPAAP